MLQNLQQEQKENEVYLEERRNITIITCVIENINKRVYGKSILREKNCSSLSINLRNQIFTMVKGELVLCNVDFSFTIIPQAQKTRYY